MNKVAFIRNKYYTDDGMEYVFRRLKEEAAALDLILDYAHPYADYPAKPFGYGYAVFWDKDVNLAYTLQRAGTRLFNKAQAIEICDDKAKTFAAVCGKVELPRTVVAPTVYDVSSGEDSGFLDYVEREIGYPVVVKQCVGSQGKQVYLANDRAELCELHSRLVHVPHLFQRFVRCKEQGSDTRVYVVGDKAVGAVNRTNTTDFRSNTALGGIMRRIELTQELSCAAESVAAAIGLDYGSVDFMLENGKYVFIEANSSPYMKNAESAGIDLPRIYAGYLRRVIHEA